MGLRAAGGMPIVQVPAVMWLSVIGAGLAFIVVAGLMLQRDRETLRARRHAGATFGRLSLRWTSIYGAAWLYGAGLHLGGSLLVALFVASWLLSAALHWLHPTHTRLPAFQLGSAADHAMQ
jgi:hypothetical protein